VVALDLGVRELVAGGVAPPPVAAVDHVDLAGAGRDHHKQVSLGRVVGRGDLLDADVQGLLDQGGGDLVDAFPEPRQLHRRQAGWGGRVALVEAVHQYAAVGGELREVLGEFLVGRPAWRQLTLDVKGVPFDQEPLIEQVAQAVFGVGQPISHRSVLLVGAVGSGPLP
jgi:hypothetical protein